MQNNNFFKSEYAYGFHKPEEHVFKAEKGISEAVVRQISGRKHEPSWMLNRRLLSYALFQKKQLPTWGADLSAINFQDIYYYIKPIDKNVSSWVS